MLERISIKNIALIEAIEIPFREGLNILSGETGAGKSMILESISLLLGSRANLDLLRTGQDEGMVEGLFDLTAMPWVLERLDQAGIPREEHQLIVRRILKRDGKHRIFLNGASTTLQTLQKICEDLIDLCGQHEHQSLLKPRTQMELLDRFAETTELAERWQAELKRLHSLEERRGHLLSNVGELQTQADFVRFQMKELKDANLRSGEEEELEEEKEKLALRAQEMESWQRAQELLDDEELGVLSKLRRLHHLLKQKLKSATPQEWGYVERAQAELEELSLLVNRQVGGGDSDPERLENIRERLAVLSNLKRKYGTTIEEMLSRLESLQKRLEELDTSDEKLKELEREEKALVEVLLREGKSLFQKRESAAAKLSKRVTSELQDLRMLDAKLEFKLSELLHAESRTQWGALGPCELNIGIQTNVGSEMRPLGRIASGGELSRVMLAMRRVIADRGGIGVYLFDEIDAGIGGQTAFEVGKKLKSVAKHHQVLCITHLPQVACFADHHLVVEKMVASGKTRTQVRELRDQTRKEEIARMLGGPVLSKKSMDNASELLKLAR
jgi:DNA repair protein RecN (Recombination protein N)